MTIRSTLPLSMPEIAAEYGASLPFSLLSVRGQPGLPSSGPVSFTDLLGKSAQPAVTVGLSPNSVHQSGIQAFRTLPAVTASVSGGVVSAYDWSFAGINGGTWVIVSGNGSATATPRVMGVAASETAEAVLVCTITVNGQQYQASANLSYFNTSTN